MISGGKKQNKTKEAVKVREGQVFLRGCSTFRERWGGGGQDCELQAGEKELAIPQEHREPPEPCRGLDGTSQLWVSVSQEQWYREQMRGTY